MPVWGIDFFVEYGADADADAKAKAIISELVDYLIAIQQAPRRLASVPQLPGTMRAVAIETAGGPEVLRVADMPVPRPAAGEVLIAVEAAGVNRPDVFQRQGLYPPPPGASEIPGLEVAGTVVEAGEGVAQPAVGRRVCALLSGGGYAEYAVAPAGQCLPVPIGFSAVEAAALPETFFTVWSNVFDRGRLQPGESLLVHGGSSGIGTTAIQMGAALGATVYATAGSGGKCAVGEELGATLAVNYRQKDFVEVLRDATGGRGIDVTLIWLPARTSTQCTAGGSRRPDRDHRVSGWQCRDGGFPGGDDETTGRYRLYAAGAFGRVQDRYCAQPAGANLAVAGGGANPPGDPPAIRSGRSGHGARADGKQPAYRQTRVTDGLNCAGLRRSALMAYK